MQIPVIEMKCASKVRLPERQVDLSSKQSQRGNLREFLLPFLNIPCWPYQELFNGRDIMIALNTNGILTDESCQFYLKGLR